MEKTNKQICIQCGQVLNDKDVERHFNKYSHNLFKTYGPLTPCEIIRGFKKQEDFVGIYR